MVMMIYLNSAENDVFLLDNDFCLIINTNVLFSIVEPFFVSPDFRL